MGQMVNRRRVITQEDPGIPLTFTAVEDGTFSYTKDCKYSLDGSSWVSLPANTQSPVVLAGNKIMWRGTISPCGRFSSTGIFDVSGNVTSIKNRRFSHNKRLVSSQYEGLFKSSKVRDASLLILPAATLVYRCYCSMFESCTNLIAAPVLPATTLGIQCYASMFTKCSNLVTAPDLLVTTAENLNCYYGMFSQCTKLTYIKCLLETPGSNTTAWTYLINTEGTFVKNPNATWGTGNNGVPSKWTIIDNE